MSDICGNACTGCMACYNICENNAIYIYINEEGFSYPKINKIKCIECNRCFDVCPVINNIKKEVVKREVYAFQSNNKKIIKKSSSGGLFYEISRYILLNNGVVFGAAFDSSLYLRHTYVEKIEDIHLLQGSKYIQSEIGYTFKKIKKMLDDDVYVLFSGTSCQVAGLKKYLCKNYKNLITLDFVCHGVPSMMVFKKYINWLENKYNKKIIKYFFRDKKWSWHYFNIKAMFDDGTIYNGKWHDDPFMRGFLRELYLRPCCHKCLYANIEKPSDITMGDFWGYKDNEVLFDNDIGISLAIMNSKKGKYIFNIIKSNGNISVRGTEDEAISGNKALRESFPVSRYRDSFFIDLSNYGFGYTVQKYLFPEKKGRKSKLIYLIGSQNMLYKLIYKIFYKMNKYTLL